MATGIDFQEACEPFPVRPEDLFTTDQISHIKTTKDAIYDLINHNFPFSIYNALQDGDAVIADDQFEIFMRDQKRAKPVGSVLRVYLLRADDLGSTIDKCWSRFIQAGLTEDSVHPKPRTWRQFAENNSVGTDNAVFFKVMSYRIESYRRQDSTAVQKIITMTLDISEYHKKTSNRYSGHIGTIELLCTPFKTREELKKAFGFQLMYTNQRLFLSHDFYRKAGIP